VQVAYPVLIDRLVASLGGATNAARDLRVGDRLPVVTDHDIRVRRPGGAVTNVAAGTPAPIADVPGFWTVTSDGRPDRVLAVDAPERESSLKPVADLPVEPRPVNPGERAPRGEVPLLPWLAAALGVLALGEWLLARRRLGVPRRQWRVATIARLAVVALVLGALVAPSIRTRVDRVATMFLIDGSDSLGAGGRADAVAWVRDALKAQHGSDRAGVAVFGGDARLELTVQQRAALEGSTVKVDASRTNLAGALRLAGAVLPSDAKRRIVLVSDGRPTDGDATAEIDRLKAAGVPVDVHLVGRAGGSDVSVGRVDVPGNVHVGERFDVRATIVATDAGPARVTLLRDGSAIDERVVDLVAGPNDISFSQVAPATSGTVRFQVQITQAGDSVAENDTGFGAVIVEGAPRVLVVEGVNGEAATLAAALRAGGISVDVTPLAKLPSAEQLSGYASTVLVDVDANNMAPDQVAALGSATRDAGRGLVVVGGDHAYELGGYRSSALEDLLPVVSEVTDPKRRLDVAQVLAIDTSGSMGACHCAQGSTLNGVITGGNLMGPAGGVSKTDISKAAAARTIEALGANDEVGVLAFNTEQKWVVPLQKLPPQDVVSRGIRSLTPAGGTDLHDPLQTAAAKLRASQAKLKHIILFTDGFTNPGVLDDLATQAKALADEGITVSVLATGEVAYDELKKVADAGRGRFYAGEDLQRIPQLMVQEALLAARDVVQEGRFLPTVTSTAAPVRSLTASPAILGYLATTAKPTAVTHLVLGEEKDPLLASWQLGLGRVTAWTSDAAARWSKEWAGWDGYAAFWTGVVKDTFPAGGDSGGAVRASVVGNRMKITVEQPGSFAADATATARVASPDGSTQEVALRRVDDATFAGEADASSAGTYSVGASVGAGAGPVLSATTLASQSYAAEYQPGLPDRALLEGLSARSGGRGSIQAAQAFDGAGLRSGRSSLRLAPWFLLAAALVWPMAVALSRLSLRGSVASAVGSGWQRTGHALRSLARRAPRPGVPASARPASSRAPTPVSAPGDGAVGPDHPTAPSPGGASAAPDAGEGTTPSQDGPRPPADNLGKLLERKRNR
jgi:Mg-chelatase subunit ChlD